jgi:hypothetical protein
MKKLEYISIPRGLASALSRDTRMAKTMSVFYQLKSLYIGGIVHNFPARMKEIANTFGYSDRKLRTYISILKEEKLVSVDKNKSLTLRSSKFVGQKFKVSTTKYTKLNVDNLLDAEKLFMSLAIQENLMKQAYTLYDKVIDHAIYDSVGIKNPSTRMCRNSYRRLKKQYLGSIESELAHLQKRYTDSISNLEQPKGFLFPFLTLTRQGIATLFGKTSKSTGHRYAKLLSGLQFIHDRNNNNVIIKEGATYEEYCAMIQHVFDYDYSFRFNKGVIYKVLPNMISLNQGILS